MERSCKRHGGGRCTVVALQSHCENIVHRAHRALLQAVQRCMLCDHDMYLPEMQHTHDFNLGLEFECRNLRTPTDRLIVVQRERAEVLTIPV
jgi:hypothetical protein